MHLIDKMHKKTICIGKWFYLQNDVFFTFQPYLQVLPTRQIRRQ